MNNASLSALQPFLRPYAEWLVSRAPFAGATSVRITSVLRSRAQQQQLWDNYLAGRSRFPAAPPGSSKHEYGLAFDMVTEPFSALDTLGRWWQQQNGEWSKTDPIHFAAKWR
jgi:hypothetical protein